MVGHFLEQNRRHRSSLSQPANKTSEFKSGTANISSASTSASSSVSSTSSVPTDANFRTTHHQHATVGANAAMSMSSSNAYGYNVNGGGVNSNTTTMNSNGNHHHHHPQQQMGMKPTVVHEGYPPAHYTTPQNLTAEAVAALPPPGAFESAIFSSRLICICFCDFLLYSILFFL